MTYANSWKRAHGATVVITPAVTSPQTINDATVIGIPGDEAELIEKTTLGSSRKEYDVSDAVDSPNIEIRASWTGAASLAGEEDCTIEIDLPSAGLAPAAFKAHVVSDLPQPAEVAGLLVRVITLKPMGDNS
jgi:hypothetical protein